MIEDDVKRADDESILSGMENKNNYEEIHQRDK